jgi:hypothetical protein
MIDSDIVPKPRVIALMGQRDLDKEPLPASLKQRVEQLTQQVQPRLLLVAL